MKKYILLTLILTVIVIGPFAYQKWSEAKRLQHIRETKQLASQIQATSLTDYLHQLKQVSPDGTPLLLFTGNTQAQLEPCGCFIGQSGGLPRRAKATGGVSVAHHNLVKSLETYAALDVVGERDEHFNENVQGIRFQRNDKSAFLKLIQGNYDAVLLGSHQDTQFLSLLRYIDAPFVVPIYSARGHNGDVINAGLLWYTAMRPFDAFLVPTNSVSDLYGRFVYKKDVFQLTHGKK
ncbi:hypothetical protein F4X88_14950 [Candidatus Poribacteria bacterium]|nr:hypothetical protein [Candidatus Poribacteria bacterium]